MNTRCLRLPAILVALFAVSWSPAGDLPQAPAPHEKKTTAELLLGKWQMVRDGGKPLLPLSAVHMEFTPDGRFKTVAEDAVRKFVDVGTGTYKLKDHTITLTTEASELHPARNWEVKIERLTETELVASTGDKASQRSDFVRVVEKK